MQIWFDHVCNRLAMALTSTEEKEQHMQKNSFATLNTVLLPGMRCLQTGHTAAHTEQTGRWASKVLVAARTE